MPWDMRRPLCLDGLGAVNVCLRQRAPARPRSGRACRGERARADRFGQRGVRRPPPSAAPRSVRYRAPPRPPSSREVRACLRIWVSNASDKVTRFPAANPSKAENFKTGFVNSGLSIDSQGNVWVTNRFGDGLLGMARLVDMAARLK